jgi:hypothetical protein
LTVNGTGLKVNRTNLNMSGTVFNARPHVKYLFRNVLIVSHAGGVYMGEWIQGKMHGQGFMLYPDGEHYIGPVPAPPSETNRTRVAFAPTIRNAE